MTYVHILRSLAGLDRYYVGATCDLRARLKKHNNAGFRIREISQISFGQGLREEAPSDASSMVGRLTRGVQASRRSEWRPIRRFAVPLLLEEKHRYFLGLHTSSRLR
jgi:hypothetical protein